MSCSLSIWMSQRWWKLSFGSSPSYRSFVDHSMWPQQSAASPILGQVGLVPCRALSLGWGHPHLVTLNPRTCPLQYKLSSSHHIRVWVLFSSNFPLRNRHLHYNYDVESFCYESGPLFLFYTTMAISPFVIRAWTHLVLCFICIYNFRLWVYPFLLVFFDSLAAKAFLARSIKLCSVDNQWSSGVTVVGVQIMSD
jgi:hypothetical protein